MKITILIPVFNEKNYILKVLKKVNLQKKNYNLEIIVVDDYSTDGTIELLKNNSHLYDKIFYYYSLKTLCFKTKNRVNFA